MFTSKQLSVNVTSHESDHHHHHTIERFLDRKSPLFRFPHDHFDDDDRDAPRIFDRYEILNENFEKIRLRLDVKNLDEYYSTSQSYSQLYVSQQRPYVNSTENLNIKGKSDDRTFTDINIHASKRSLHASVPTFKIDCALVNRIELDWPILFTNFIAQLKPSIIYHFVTLRFEFQAHAASSLNDTERSAVKKLTELLAPMLDEKQ